MYTILYENPVRFETTTLAGTLFDDYDLHYSAATTVGRSGRPRAHNRLHTRAQRVVGAAVADIGRRRPLTCVRLSATAAATAPDRGRTDIFPPQTYPRDILFLFLFEHQSRNFYDSSEGVLHQRYFLLCGIWV